jgi:L-seryl-tRNA(Ser) seleniumtransferase
MDKINGILKKIPAVDAVVKHLEDRAEIEDLPRPLLVEGVRGAVDEMRRTILEASDQEAEAMDISLEIVARAALRLIKNQASRNLKRVVNATGTILHTNLGRSLLAKEALEAVVDVAGHYSNLEYNLDLGERGERYDHVEEMLCRLTGAEKALVVNNNAAAVLLALSTLAKGKETVVSRGELVEIGGSFRIPAVMELSGTRLVEVGTTNKTHLSDYRDALTENTALLLKVHTSNYRVVGFTEEVPLKDLAALGEQHGLPVLEDLGSGVLVDLAPFGFPEEPTVGSRIADGASVVTFSGDKLLGGPQAGIIVGREKYITAMKKNQLTRALRIDKLTLAALEATLLLYLKDTLSRVPTWRMLTVKVADLEAGPKAWPGILKHACRGGERWKS